MGKCYLTDLTCSLSSLIPDVNNDKNLILTVSKHKHGWRLVGAG